MAMNGLANLAEALHNPKNEIHVNAQIGRRAQRSIQRMLDFAKGMNLQVAPPAGADQAHVQTQALSNGIGAA